MKQGPSTLVVSLPRSYTKRFNITKGTLVHVEENGCVLTVSVEKQHTNRAISLDLSYTLPVTHRIVGALYMAGFDEMILSYSAAAEAETIIETVSHLTGHEVIEHRDKKIMIRRIAQTDNGSFEMLYRKCFPIASDMARDTVHALTSLAEKQGKKE